MKLVTPQFTLPLWLILLSFSAQIYAQPADNKSLSAQLAIANGVEVPGSVTVTQHPLDVTSQAENLYRRAIVLLQQGLRGQAEARLYQALELQQKHYAARELLISLLLKKNAQQQAINLLREGMQNLPEHTRFPLWLSQLYRRNNDTDTALALLEQHQERFSQQADYLGALADLYQHTDRHADAQQYFLLAAQRAPQDGRWWLGLGIAAEYQQNWQLAKDAYRRARDYSFIEGALLQFAERRLGFVNVQIEQQKS